MCLGVALIVGVTAAVDLRRLQRPDGAALAWTGAAVFGDCTAFRELSLEARPGADADDDRRCVSLRRRSASARERPSDVEIDVVEVRERDDRATVRVRVRRPGRGPREVELELRRHGGRWAVQVTDAICEAVPCP